MKLLYFLVEKWRRSRNFMAARKPGLIIIDDHNNEEWENFFKFPQDCNNRTMVNPKIHSIAEIKSNSFQWTIRVRVVRLYNLMSEKDPNTPYQMEMVLMDKDGLRIHASVNAQLLQKWVGKFSVGSYYEIQNFIAKKDIRSTKTANHDFRIYFIDGKTISEGFVGKNFPGIYSFIEFQDIIQHPEEFNSILIDVIGHVVETTDSRSVSGNKKILELKLENLSGTRLTCSLWDEYADQMEKLLLTKDAEPLIVVMQMVRVRIWKSEGSISNTFNSTNIIVADNSAEFEEYRTSIKLRDAESTQVSQMSSGSTYSVTEGLVNKTEELKTIDDLEKLPTSPTYSTCCTNGKVILPSTTTPPQILDDLLHGSDEKSKHFKQNIRSFNSMFCFTSMGGKIDSSLNKGGSPPIFRIHGQNYHRIGSLLPTDGDAPRFAQLYIYDTDNEVSNRLKALSGESSINTIHAEIVADLK